MKNSAALCLFVYLSTCLSFAIADETEPSSVMRLSQFVADFADNSDLDADDFQVFSPDVREYLGVDEPDPDIYGFSKRLEGGDFLFVTTYKGGYGPVSRAAVIFDSSLKNQDNLVSPAIDWQWRPLFLPRFNSKTPYSWIVASDQHAELFWIERSGGLLQETYCKHSINDQTEHICLRYFFKLTSAGSSHLWEMQGLPIDAKKPDQWVPLWKQGKWQIEFKD